MKLALPRHLVMFAMAVLVLVPRAISAAPPVQVTAADPTSASQGTVSLDVTVSGSGFDSSAAVDFLVTGTVNPGGITVRQVTVLGSKKLVARIDVADAAIVGSFDIQVTLSGGRKGKGTSLFAVLQKSNADPCTIAGLDFPAFTYQQVDGQQEKLFVADATGTCSRLLHNTGTNNTASLTQSGFSYPVDGTSDHGRVVWRDSSTSVAEMTFHVSGTAVTTEPMRSLYSGDIAFAMDLSGNGSTVFVGTFPDATNVARIIAIEVATSGFSVRFTGPPDGSYPASLSVDSDGTLYVDWRLASYANGVRVLRIDPSCSTLTCATVLIASPSGTTANFYPAANPAGSELAYSEYLAGYNNCWLLQVIPDNGGPTLNSGQPRYGERVTWLDGMILTNGRTSPDRKGKCAETGMITVIDPVSSAELPLVQGRDPNAR